MNEIALIRERLGDYLSNAIPLRDFEEWFVPFYWELSGDRDAIAVSRRIMGKLAEFAGGYRTEASLRKELADAIHPFLMVGTNVAGDPESRPVAESEFPFETVSASAA